MTSGYPFPSSWWDPARFVRTLSYFGAIPVLSEQEWFQAMLGSRANPRVDGTAWAPSRGKVFVLGQAGLLSDRIRQALEQQGYQVEGRSPEQIDASDQFCGLVILPDVTQPHLGEYLNHLRPHLRSPSLTLFDFTRPDPNLRDVWGALDDVVMGGVSESHLSFVEGAALFAGHVSTANSGGFASVRTRNFEPPLNLSGSDGLELRVQGDGNRYKFLIRSESAWDGVAYSYSFDTVAETWITVRIPFAELTPVFRARTVQVSPIDASRVYALQVMLSKFEYDGALNPHFAAGPFKLKIAAIGTYQNAVCPQVVLLSPGHDQHQTWEAVVRTSGLPYTILRYAQVTDSPAGQPLTVEPQGWLAAGIGAADLAAVVVQAIARPQATNTTVAIANGMGICPPGDWDCLFSRLRPDVRS